MEFHNSQIMQQAWSSLKGKWDTALCVAGFILLIELIGIFMDIFIDIPMFDFFVMAIISAPLCLGVAIFALKSAKNKDISFTDALAGFNNFGSSLGLYFLSFLLILAWSLLLIIPGIIAAFSYAMSFFILAENPDMPVTKILKKSKTMMHGYKWKFFFLNCRFIGWSILCIPTLGIGLFWLIPYMEVSYAHFYLELKKRQNIA